jgi:hypothetical protein
MSNRHYSSVTFVVSLLLSFFIYSCQSNLTDPQIIIDKAITAAGGEKYLNSTIEFDFRDRHYVARREGGTFSYERIFKEPKDSTQNVHDFVSNDGFKREINGVISEVADSMAVKYTSSTNSVLYFALLPYALNDPSVRKKFLGESKMDGKDYYMVEVTFEAGGGEDYQDVFHYWINKKDFRIDFMSYSYSESDGIGYRLRKAYNPRMVNGILFQDYINYKPKGAEKLEQLEELYKKNELEELSKIELLNITVK